ncbi:MAG: hypothetical protein M9928_21775 [Anaerolineae bacterium]|nr:hypothetical protein [Anaerolineae bacterium]
MTDEDVAGLAQRLDCRSGQHDGLQTHTEAAGGEGAQDIITVWLPQWKARAMKDNGGAVDEPPF